MKIDKHTIDYIKSAVRTAEELEIDALIIEPERIRATNEQNTIFICHTTGVPPLPFGSIGINRINMFNSRLDLVSDKPSFEVDVTVDGPEHAQFARSITFKAAGVKVDYRCANPATMRAPKTIGFTTKYTVAFDSSLLPYLKRAETAMKATTVAIVFEEDAAFIQLKDINGDVLQYQFSDQVQHEEDAGAAPSSFSYPIKLLTTALKSASPQMAFSTRGLLKVRTNGLDTVIFPES